MRFFLGCHFEEPVVWNSGCVQLSPVNDEYRLSGPCCDYLDFTVVSFEQGDQLTLNGMFSKYDTGKIKKIATVVTINSASDRDEITVKFGVSRRKYTYVLSPGSATVTCDCVCR